MVFHHILALSKEHWRDQGRKLLCVVYFLFMMNLKDNVSDFFNHGFFIMFPVRMNVSYECITHVEGSGFNVYQSKGQPSQETIDLMSVPKHMEENINSLHC